MSTITQDQVLCLHNQVQRITRYFSQSFFTEQATSKIYRLIRKINRVRNFSELTISQYNITMRHLGRLEHAGYLLALARFAIEKKLLEKMLAWEIITNESKYVRPDFSLEALERSEKMAWEIINFDKLFTLI